MFKCHVISCILLDKRHGEGMKINYEAFKIYKKEKEIILNTLFSWILKQKF
jgi:hypothetical protein